MEQDTGKFRTNTKDQYYTKPAVAKACVDILLNTIPYARNCQWIEPSAGSGVFLTAVPAGIERFGMDLEPKNPEIMEGNFLDWAPVAPRKRIFFGNPPFGRQSSLAKGFIKHAAKFGDVIAFILPRSFVKPSMSRAFPPLFHCMYSEPIESRAFEVNGVEYDVPCVFQIWEKRLVPRPVQEAVEEQGFQYVKPGEAYHIAFKRAGGLAGKCYAAAAGTYNPQYHNFIRLDTEFVPYLTQILEKMNAHIFPSNTTGPRSLSKSEANEVLNQVLNACAAGDE